MSHLLRNAALCAGATLLVACAGLRTSPKPTPIADRAIDLAGHCSQHEADGFREQATLVVRSNQVQVLDWHLWVGKQGSCSFKLQQFKQTKDRPHIELITRDGSQCKLMIWQEPRRVTLAHAACQAHCSGGIYEQAWPIMFDPRTGQCALRDQ